MTARRFAIPVLVLACSAYACEIPLAPKVPEPERVAPIPLTIGLYISPEFRETVYVHTHSISRYTSPIGEGSAGLLERALPTMFERVVIVGAHPPIEGAQPDLAGVIVPRLEAFSLDWPSVVFFGTAFQAKVSYRFTLYETDGTPLGSWLVTGSGKRLATPEHLLSTTTAGVAFDRAAQSAVKKFMVGFRRTPEAKRWMRRAGVEVPK